MVLGTLYSAMAFGRLASLAEVPGILAAYGPMNYVPASAQRPWC